MKKILFVSVASLLILACNNDEKKEDAASKKDADMKALYEKNLAALKTDFAAFEKEDLTTFAAGLADSLVWNSPVYGDTIKTKAHYLEGLKYYVDNWDNIKFNDATYLPGVDSATQELDGSVRCYGRWDAVHKSGTITHSNYYATADFNKDSKITNYTEFFDVGGLMNAVTPKK